MRRVVKLLLACATVAVPLHLTDAVASPGAPGQNEYAMAEQAFSVGRVKDGLTALETAVSRNVLSAQIRLGRIYSEGALVTKDEVKACKLFEAAVEGHPGYDKMHPEAAAMGEALRSLGLCYLKGVAAPGWDRDSARAAELFLQAGATFEDAPGLFELAQLYLKGDGVRNNPRLAINFLFSAARKRYAPAQALLGSMMWEGKLMKRQSGAGLALLIMAKESTSQTEYRAWINRLYEDAVLTASKDEEYASTALARNWKKAYGTDESRAQEATNSIPSAIPQSMPQAAMQPVAIIKETDGIPLPIKAPWRQEQNQFGNMPTGADVPEAASPIQP